MFFRQGVISERAVGQRRNCQIEWHYFAESSAGGLNLWYHPLSWLNKLMPDKILARRPVLPFSLRLAATMAMTEAAPLMATMMLMARNPRVMGTLVLPVYLVVLGWLGTVVMAAASIAFLVL